MGGAASGEGDGAAGGGLFTFGIVAVGGSDAVAVGHGGEFTARTGSGGGEVVGVEGGASGSRNDFERASCV